MSLLLEQRRAAHPTATGTKVKGMYTIGEHRQQTKSRFSFSFFLWTCF